MTADKERQRRQYVLGETALTDEEARILVTHWRKIDNGGKEPEQT